MTDTLDTAAPTSAAPAPIELSPEQRAAVEHTGGPLIVLAGPGTGKTRVLTARIAHLVRSGVEPESVLAVTFTNKAAEELRERLGALLGPVTAQRVNAGTLHAYGMRLLQRFGDTLGLPREIEILDEAQQRRLARELIRANGLYRASIGRGVEHAVEHALGVAHELVSAGLKPADALARIDRALSALDADSSPDAAARRAQLRLAREGAESARLLDEACLDRGVARFDDLITWPMEVLRRSTLAADIVRWECRHAVVDEFQDFNATQIAWLAEFCPPASGPDLCVVGDDDQSIYGFRGADERAFDRFKSLWPGATTLRLTTNYRSGPAVVEAANAVIDRAGYRFDAGKVGVPGPNAPGASSVELVRTGSDLCVGEVAASMVRHAIDADPGLDLSEIAVIARTNPELLRAAGAFEAAGVPFVCSTPDASRENPGVRTVLAWAALAVDPTRTWEARAVLTRPPFNLDAPTIGALEHRYRTARAWANANPGEDEPGPFVAWLSAHAPDNFEDALRRAAEVEREVADFAAAHTADQALMHIVRLTGAAHAESLPPRERAARVRAVVRLLRFARERLDRLDEPRGLREFLAYLEDLPPGDRVFGCTPEDTVRGSAEADLAGPGVRLLTAHASKGLEFDTVYLLRCTSPHGFPKATGDAPRLPDGVLDPDPSGRDLRARRDDEERRVFFVALTRAKRRAVLLGKVPKKTTGTSYPLELLEDLGPAIVEHDEADLLGPVIDDLTGLEIDAGSAAERAAVLASERRAARRAAAAALDAAESADEPDEAIAERLRQAADTLAMIRAVERSGTPPRWADAAGLGEHARRLAARLSEGAADDTVFPGVTGALTLSYTHVKQYLDCPRCYYLSFVQEMPGEDAGDAVNLGKIVHRALQHFCSAWTDADSRGDALPAWDALESHVNACFRCEWPRHLEFDSEQLERALAMARVFLEQLHPADAHVLHVEKRFRMPFEVDGLTHTVTGVIDRIDMTQGGGVRLIDYKTGYPSKAFTSPEKSDLQMGIYAMALPSLGIEPAPGSTCEYWLLASGERGSIGLDTLATDKVRQKIAGVVRGIGAGAWDRGTRCSGACDFLDGPED